MCIRDRRKEDQSIMLRALKTISQELDDNQVVCIFPEGQLTRNGKLNLFRPGIQKMVESTPSPVVPFVIRGLWGSIFTRDPHKKFSFQKRQIELEFFNPIESDKFNFQNLEAVVARELNEPAPYSLNNTKT